MISVLGWLLGLLAIIVLVPVLVLVLQVLLACLPARSRPEGIGERPRVAVLVPAHDEALVIRAMLASVTPQLLDGDRLLVVADNCSDDTARLARASGAEVVERRDTRLRGKGYALDFGVRHLAQRPPEVVIVVDADCQVGEGAIDCLARRCLELGRPVQSLYLMRAPAGAGLRVQVAEFAWRVKNLVRPRGWARLGLPCQLMGAGMAFGWHDLSLINLANGHLVEDVKLGLDLCQQGKPPAFCPEALVTSQFPLSQQGLNSQRTRWEHGHLGLMLADAPKRAKAAITQRNASLAALTLDLLVPPLALLVLALLGLNLVTWLAYLLFGLALPAWLALAGLALLAFAVVLAWARFCREVIPFSVLLYAPFYAARKIPLYLSFLIKRQVEWVRSKRDDD
ncbi:MULTISPECIES: glycosyltransferase family 2 protein [Pseudomonas]|uniref:glycosyltransferase family 2 protein n=1 Tax=Pseudomonas TaxID=286 RepID=UPI00159E5EDE|nr:MULTISPECIES: glycosyltransferase family 2 protein [Pseudomonas]MBP2271574.1 cellulose synthase/poly-beta-1,6-N-acetylglucosamine synthase-like glycosyltransferase [Pseudomonas sp. BP6]MBP2289455.1 cellulose synthase/poly-beta-1,6-N-acetylglucosamine synthase-like glycosyltransferase [Pseudomonas sp. BP7]NVN64199.1 glycosyltransferase [Pseudomonas putida]NVN69453.1 glycosyltransferase [Pseudomonas putida]HDS1695009.1 glycosyltransferase [Pseudomonas putida]